MKKIQLTEGKYAIVDDRDYSFLCQSNWRAERHRRVDRDVWYASRREKFPDGRWMTIYMHRLINKTPKGIGTDHINGNGLDNRRVNLRTCNTAQNQWNRGLDPTNKSGYKGVNCRPNLSIKRWRAEIAVNGKRLHLGYFKTAEAAAHAYDLAALQHHGRFAVTNIMLSRLRQCEMELKA